MRTVRTWLAGQRQTPAEMRPARVGAPIADNSLTVWEKELYRSQRIAVMTFIAT